MAYVRPRGWCEVYVPEDKVKKLIDARELAAADTVGA